MVIPQQAQVVVAGHICLDVIPTFPDLTEAHAALFVPGKLNNVGPVVTSTGGTVSNTGLALHRLGVPTRLMGKVGDDLFGRAILDALRAHGDALVQDMIVGRGEATSYSIVLNPPGVDRIFFHCPGANDTFTAGDVAVERLAGARLFHFGYPPLMRSIFVDGGVGLADLMQRAKSAGLATSLDMAYPDPDSDAGKVDWQSFLARVLPRVDIFLPSLEEVAFIFGHPVGDASAATGDLLRSLGDCLLEMGAAVAVIKLGDNGLYARTTPVPGRIQSLGRAAPSDPSAWVGRELLAPCFEVDVVGTTGAGDCTIAGFLAGLLHGNSVEAAMTHAVAAGAFNVESADATSGIPSWDVLRARVAGGWRRRSVTLPLDDWHWDETARCWIGPSDRSRAQTGALARG